MKGMAFRQALQAQPNAAKCAVLLDRLQHVCGAGWIKPAGGKQPRGDAQFIDTQGADHDPLQRRKRRATSLSRSGNGACIALRRGLKTIDHSGLRCPRCRRDRFADTPADAVARHCFPDGAWQSETDPRAARIELPHAECGKEGSGEAGTLVINSAEVLGSQQTNTFRETRYGYLSELTVSLWRPRARRRAKTARPFFVSIRERKPCVFARRRLLG